MRVGDTIQSAAWLTGAETPTDRKRWEDRVTEAIDNLCGERGFTRGPVRFAEKHPLDSEVPPVPDHIQGPDVRLLVAEAEVTGEAPKVEARGFLGDLDRKDLERLRAITRQAHAKRHPGETLTDLECDDIIEEVGPEAAMDAVRKAVNGERVH